MGSNKNILLISPWFKPSWKNGGTVTAVVNYVRILVKLGYNVTVLTTKQNGNDKLDIKHEVKEKNLTIYYYDCLIRFKGAAWSPGLVFSILRKWKKFDIIHLQSSRTLYEIIAWFLNILIPKKIILTPHASLMSSWIENIGNSTLSKLYNFIAKKTFYKKFIFHYLSIDEYNQSANKKNFVIIPNSLNLQNQEKTCFNKKAIFIGRIHPQKDIVKMFNWIKANKEWNLDLFGPVDDVNYHSFLLKRLSELNIASRINWMGYVKNSNLINMISDYSLLLMPSIVEGVSMTMMEAMSKGLPVICSNGVGNKHEILKYGSGLIVNSWDLNSPELTFDYSAIFELSKNSSKMYKDLYYEESVIQKWKKFLNEINDIYSKY